MAYIPNEWSTAKVTWRELRSTQLLGSAMGWTFWEHPVFGDEYPVLAVSLDHIGDTGPIVWNTNEYDIPDYL